MKFSKIAMALLDGNIISIGIKEIACYKGDATTVEPNGWSKLYGNTGNTSSR